MLMSDWSSDVCSSDLMPKLRVGFILAPRFTLAAFANFVDAVRLAADDGDRSQQIECEWEVLGEPGEMIESSCGLHVQPWGVIASPERFEYSVVVGGILHGKTRDSSHVTVFLTHSESTRGPLLCLCTG